MDLSTVVYVLGAILYGIWRNRSKSVETKPQAKPVWTPPPPDLAYTSAQPVPSAAPKRPKSSKAAPSFAEPTAASTPAKDQPSPQDYRPVSQEDWKKIVIGSVLLEPRFDHPYQGPAQGHL